MKLMKEFTGIRKRGKMYQFNVTVNGKRVARSAATLEEAVKERESWRSGMQTGTMQETRTTRAPVVYVPPPTSSLKVLYDLAYTQCWEGRKGEKTASINAKAALQYFGARTEANTINIDRVREYIDALEFAGNSNGTINRKLSALSLMLKIGRENGLVQTPLTFRRRPEYRGRDRFITHAEEQKMLALLDFWNFVDFKDVIITLVDTGIRTGELLKLQKKDLTFGKGERNLLTLWETKTDQPRSIPMTERVDAIMKRRFETVDDVFVFPYTKAWIRVRWDRMKAQLGLAEDKQFIPHILRHTCASRLVQKGVPLFTVQKFMGHATPATTNRYAHLAPESLYAAAEALNM